MGNLFSDSVFLSVVIPAFNEEKKIEEDLVLLFGYLNQKQFKSEVIVVDDGSRDKTFEILKNLESKYKNLRGIHYDQNRGKGYAVKTGILQSQGEYILFADAGSCVPYSDLEEGLKLLYDGFDVAIGSRALDNSEIIKKQPTYRVIGSRVFSIIVHSVMGLPHIKDTQCGFKLFKRQAADQIFSRNKIDGFMFDIETLLNAKRLGFKLKEFPISWKNDPDTRFHPFGGSFRIMKELMKIKFGRG